MKHLENDPSYRLQCGEIVAEYIYSNTGATKKILDDIAPVLQ